MYQSTPYRLSVNCEIVNLPVQSIEGIVGLSGRIDITEGDGGRGAEAQLSTRYKICISLSIDWLKLLKDLYKDLYKTFI